MTRKLMYGARTRWQEQDIRRRLMTGGQEPMTTKKIARNQYGEIVYSEQECGCIWTDGQMDFCAEHQRIDNDRRAKRRGA